jgi:DNA-binding response OmpR family regulator
MAKIVIVEDDQAISQMYSFKFEVEGFDVTVAEDGKTGLDIITAKRPDIILLDLMIPAMSGDKMLQAMRKQEWAASIKVIVLTNISRADAPPILNDLNIDRYIVKAQMTPSQIVEIVREVLGEK